VIRIVSLVESSTFLVALPDNYKSMGFSPHTLKALQLKMLIGELGDLDIEEVSLNLLKEYLAKQSERLKSKPVLLSSFKI
jgi:hypothetical protein